MPNIDKFIKKNEYGNNVFDFEAINNEGFPINVIISERGQKGKTYGMKDFLYRDYLAHPEDTRITALWLRSQKTNADEESRRFLNDIPEVMRDDLDKELVKDCLYVDEKPYIYFKSVSTPGNTKGTRTIVRHIVWDEFNDSIKNFKKSLVDNLMNILSSVDNPNERTIDGQNTRKLWMLGNNRGLNHPLLISLGVETITEEVTQIYDKNNNKLVQIICPVYTEMEIDQMEEKLKNDWMFQLNKMVGTANHIYYNEVNNFNDLNYIQTLIDFDPNSKEDVLKVFLAPKIDPSKDLQLQATYMIDGNILNLYKINPWLKGELRLKTKFHVVNMTLYINNLNNHFEKDLDVLDFVSINNSNLKEKLIYTTNKNELSEIVKPLPTQWKELLITLFSKCDISFENATSRDNFLSLITR